MRGLCVVWCWCVCGCGLSVMKYMCRLGLVCVGVRVWMSVAVWCVG